MPTACVAPLLLAWALAGCAVFDSADQRALRNNPSFKAGYEDGCAAASAEGADLRDRPVLDKSLYGSDDTYRAGWSNGLQTCRRTTVPAGAMPGINPASNPS